MAQGAWFYPLITVAPTPQTPKKVARPQPDTPPKTPSRSSLPPTPLNKELDDIKAQDPTMASILKYLEQHQQLADLTLKANDSVVAMHGRRTYMYDRVRTGTTYVPVSYVLKLVIVCRRVTSRVECESSRIERIMIGAFITNNISTYDFPNWSCIFRTFEISKTAYQLHWSTGTVVAS